MAFKHGVRSGISELREVSDAENTSSEGIAQEWRANGGDERNTKQHDFENGKYTTISPTRVKIASASEDGRQSCDKLGAI